LTLTVAEARSRSSGLSAAYADVLRLLPEEGDQLSALSLAEDALRRFGSKKPEIKRGPTPYPALGVKRLGLIDGTMGNESTSALFDWR
jgi:hypothetical protein